MSDAPKDPVPKFVWVAFLGITSAVSALAARRTVERGWRLVTGAEPPRQPNDPDTPWPQAFGWALGSMAVMETTRLVVTRSAARYWRERTGALPPLPDPPGEHRKHGKKKKNKKKGARS